MKNIILFLVFCLLIIHKGLSQDGLYYIDNNTGQMQSLDTKESKLKFVLNNEFSRLITGSSINGIGNYASVSSSDDTFSTSINFVNKKGIFDIDISGGASDGIVPIFENDNFNPNISVGASYHFMLGKKDIELNYSEFQKIERKYNELLYKKKIDQLKAESYKFSFNKQLKAKTKELVSINEALKANKYDSEKADVYKKQLDFLISDIEAIEIKRKYYKANIDKIIEELRQVRDNPSNNDVFKYQKFKVDSLKALAYDYDLGKEIIQKKAEKKKIEGLIKNNNYSQEKEKEYLSQKKLLEKEIIEIKNKGKDYDVNLPTIKGLIRNVIDDEIYENIEKANDIKATDINLTWFTLGGKLEYQKFDLFDQTRSIDKQVFSKEDLVPTFSIAISHYTNKDLENSFLVDAKHVQFYSLGFQLNLNNNSSSLKSREIRTVDSLSPGRTLIKKENVLIGDFIDDKLSSMIYGDYYRFVGAKNNIGFHLRSTLDIGEFKPITSLRFGVLFPLINTEDKSSFLNLELFFGLNDIFEQAEKESLFNRNIIGIQATVPFNFKIL